MDSYTDIELLTSAKNDYSDLNNRQALKRSLTKNLRGEGQPYPRECRRSS
jgi:hypothetical protein